MPEYPQTKQCSKCRRVLARSEFYKNKGRPDGIQTVCKACTRLNNQERDAVDPDWWRKYAANRPPLTDEQKVNRDIRARRWVVENPERSSDLRKSRDGARRARAQGAVAIHVHPLVVLERYDGACGICGEDVDPFDFEIDHVIPISSGGEHTYANTQPAHQSCNRRKSAKAA